MRETMLVVPPVPLCVPPAVFDAFGWSVSSALMCRYPDAGLGRVPSLTSDNPPGMAFVLEAPCDFLPQELAKLHVSELSRDGEWALAPYAIDDATDLLWERSVAPGSVLRLATRSLAGLFWGLHDWAHFHNHGPFEERALTEHQCDTAALAWLVRNAPAFDIDAETLAQTHAAVTEIGRARFAAEGIEPLRLASLSELAP